MLCCIRGKLGRIGHRENRAKCTDCDRFDLIFKSIIHARIRARFDFYDVAADFVVWSALILFDLQVQLACQSRRVEMGTVTTRMCQLN